jgi:hypothetical protein
MSLAEATGAASLLRTEIISKSDQGNARKTLLLRIFLRCNCEVLLHYTLSLFDTWKLSMYSQLSTFAPFAECATAIHMSASSLPVKGKSALDGLLYFQWIIMFFFIVIESGFYHILGIKGFEMCSASPVIATCLPESIGLVPLHQLGSETMFFNFNGLIRDRNN